MSSKLTSYWTKKWFSANWSSHGSRKVFPPPLFLYVHSSSLPCSPALANTWRYHTGEWQDVCFYATLKQGETWSPLPVTCQAGSQGLHTTQGNSGNKQAGRAKSNFFWRGQFSWYYPHRKFQKSLQSLPFPTVLSFGRREYFFIIQCSLFGSWGLPTCCFQHLPFKGRRKTDGHKNISEAKYTMQNHS